MFIFLERTSLLAERCVLPRKGPDFKVWGSGNREGLNCSYVPGPPATLVLGSLGFLLGLNLHS